MKIIRFYKENGEKATMETLDKYYIERHNRTIREEFIDSMDVIYDNLSCWISDIL